ncbi:SDR family oxidoreductase [Ornithinimicrobium cavernae]|uniref:SDR family oxidoreductase n=1 Tax=Ornithinimicrobium cavernae TaxID=2666047 RepID=UPI000D68CFB8|nr:SDR family oxidoreductase [Ornithinimicrobium cavernae]
MILVSGATGQLGSRVVRALLADGQQVRALVRPASDASELEGLGAEVARGDLREPETLLAALQGVDTVVTTANAVSRILAGEKDLRIADVDGAGNRNLIRAAETAGVGRFVFVSVAGLGKGMERSAPLARAKWEAEEALRATRMQTVIVRPDMFMDVWLTPVAGIDPAAGKAVIFGRGETAHRYVATDDIGALCAHLAVAADPPAVVEVGGAEALTRNQVVAAFAAATGQTLKTRHVPRPALTLGSRTLWRLKPEVASLMGMARFYDTHPSAWDDAPLRAAGIEPRGATSFITEAAQNPTA